MLYLALLTFLLALALFLLARRREKAIGIAGGRLIYSDSRLWGKAAQPLSDPALGLIGKPDYLFKKGKHVIPVEVKSTGAEGGLYDGHVFQLTAYCLLVERTTGLRPPYGILHYSPKAGGSQITSGRTYAIDFTPELENRLLGLLVEMRRMERQSLPDRSHNSAPRCLKCSYRTTCDQVLA
ncbi:MAG: Dna2/Cas4 domain-containing protein [Anaerolineales bacterium]|nr:Dna2/Cas4 domain-containing protein [Anaerolineales bacterium]